MSGYTAVARGPETDAVLAVLTGASLKAGDSIRPEGGGYPGEDTTQPFIPYCVLFQAPTMQIEGPVGDPFADTINEYQVTSIGVTRASASVVADKVRAALLDNPLSIAGRHVNLVKWEAGRPATRDDSITPPLFYVVDIYSVSTSPA